MAQLAMYEASHHLRVENRVGWYLATQISLLEEVGTHLGRVRVSVSALAI